MSPGGGGPRVPGYAVEGRLGSGGLGSVWRARREDGTAVALKVLDPLRPVDAAAADRLFRREALAGLNLDHPGLVRALDAGRTEDGRPWIAFELVEGPTLAEAMRERGPLPPAEVLGILRALAAALDHAHRRGVVHGDVSPANVILAEGGVRLLDLGLVRPLAEEGGGPVFATPGFSAPEVAAGAPPAAAADLYSLGATAAAALPPGAAGEGLRAVVERCLRREPGERYRSAAELLLDLDAVRAGEGPLGAALATAGVRLGARRRRGLVAAVAAAGLAAAAAGWYLRPREETPPPAGGPVPAAPAPPAAAGPAAAPDPMLVRVEALRLLLGKEPPDLEGAAALAAEIREAGPSGAAAEAFVEARGRLDARREEAAAAEAERRIAAAAEAGSPEEWKRLLVEWPEPLRGTAGEARARREVERVAAYGVERGLWVDDGVLPGIDAYVSRLSSGTEEGDRALREEADRLEAAARDRALPRWARESFAGRRRTLVEPILEVRRAAWREREAAAAWGRLFAGAMEGGGFEKVGEFAAAARALARERAGTRVGLLLEDLLARWARADGRLRKETEDLEGKAWWGVTPWGDPVGPVEGVHRPADLFGPLGVTGPGGERREVADLLRLLGDGADASCWLLAEGWPQTALETAGGEGPVPGLLEGVAEWAAEDARPPVRGAGEEPGSLWAAVVAAPGDGGAGGGTRGENPARARAVEAFLADRLAAAALEVRAALEADPGDAEMWVLDARIRDGLARPLPTLGTAISALDSAARAWALDPSLSAGPVTFAGLALDFVERYPGRLAEEIRPAALRACREAVRAGRATPRIRAFLGD